MRTFTPWLPPALLGLYALVWSALAIDPLSRSDWVLENLLVWITLPTLAFYHRRLGLTNLSFVMLFVFYTLHAIGGHWSYSNVPMDWQAWGFERNHYDRIVHFSFGLLLWLPTQQAIARTVGLGPIAASLFAACIVQTGSGLYEVIEWGAVAVVAPDLGQEFLGAQGDDFDAAKDMGLAALGTLLSLGVALLAARPWRRKAPEPRAAIQVVPSQSPAVARGRLVTGPQQQADEGLRRSR